MRIAMQMKRLSTQQWHKRFQQQAGWTHELRRHLFDRFALDRLAKVLEVGCGTGAVLAEASNSCSARLYGLDFNPDYLRLAQNYAPSSGLTAGDAHCLPYASSSFDLAYCHYLLLWVKDTTQVVAEMARVTRRGGIVMLVAEPDYGARIDYPQELESLGVWQTISLRKQGADPEIGRRLAGLLAGAGLSAVEGGVLGGAWSYPLASEEWELEWQVLYDDLSRLDTELSLDSMNLNALQELDRQCWQRGERVLFVPTFFALGRKS